MKRWIIPSLFGVTLLAGMAAAQTPMPTTTTSNEGAFDRLSQGNQKIAQALFEAQKMCLPSGANSCLTRDEIATMKLHGKQGWGEVFKQMKSQGLVEERNLGQVVSRFNHHRTSSGSPGTLITTGSGRTHAVGGNGKPERSVSAGKGWSDHDSEGSGSSAAAASGNGHGNAYGREGAGLGGGHGRSGGSSGPGGGRGK